MSLEAKNIFLSLIDCPASERRARLLAACGGNALLQREVEELLKYSGYSGDLMDSLGVDWGPEPGSGEVPSALGAYRIEARLGHGATSVVYRALPTVQSGTASCANAVALKVFRGLGMGGGTARRFQVEARALVRLEHEQIPGLVDSGVFEVGGCMVPYVATRLVDGKSLADWAREMEPEVPAIANLLAEMADVLAYAHARGVIHRDLKPANVLVDASGRPHVLDFGLARLVDPGIEGQSLLTRSGQIVGTIAYMSPEQAQAGPEPVDERTDLYALGVIGYELLARRLPIDIPSDSLHRAVVAILTTEPVPLGQVRANLAGDVEALIGRLLAKRPEERYPSAAAVAEDMRRLARGEKLRLKAPTRARGGQRPLARGALALAVAAMVALGSWRLTRPSRLSAETLRTLNQAMSTLASATDRIQAPIKDKREIRAAIADLETTRDALAALPAGVPLTQIIYYLHWRMGEAHYFLGELDGNISEYRKAARCWGDGWMSGFKRDEPLPVGPGAPQYDQVAQFAEYTVPGGMALVDLALAEFETPLLHARGAVGSTERVPGGISRERSFLAGHAPADPALIQRDRCMAWNNSAEAQLLVGRLTADTTAIDTALARTARAIRAWPNPDIPGPLASMYFNRGEAWLERARLTGRGVEQDSAASSLRQALRLRPLESSPRSNLGTRVALGRWALQAAEARATPAGCEALLAAAVADIERGRTLVPLADDNPHAAEHRLVLAELAVARAAAGRRAELVTADTLLARAALVLTPERFRLKLAELQRVRALWHVCRARLGMGAGERAAAAECLRRAMDLVNETQDPAGYRRLADQLAELSAGG